MTLPTIQKGHATVMRVVPYLGSHFLDVYFPIYRGISYEVPIKSLQDCDVCNVCAQYTLSVPDAAYWNCSGCGVLISRGCSESRVP